MAEDILKNIKKSYPHMSVCENISFPLKLPKTDKAEIDQRVNQAAKILCITEYLERKPKALSGGQRQCGTSARQCLRPGHPYDHTATAIESSAAVAFGSTISFTVSGSTTHVSDRESGKNLGK